MAGRAKQNAACPVCGKGFRNPQGLGGHLKHSKDSVHLQHRPPATLPAQAPTGLPPASPALAPPASPTGASPLATPTGPAPASTGPPSDPTKVMDWAFMEAGRRLGAWMERRRALRPTVPPAQAPPPKAPPASPQAGAAQTGQADQDPYGADYWKRILDNAYRPPNQGGGE